MSNNRIFARLETDICMQMYWILISSLVILVLVAFSFFRRKTSSLFIWAKFNRYVNSKRIYFYSKCQYQNFLTLLFYLALQKINEANPQMERVLPGVIACKKHKISMHTIHTCAFSIYRRNSHQGCCSFFPSFFFFFFYKYFCFWLLCRHYFLFFATPSPICVRLLLCINFIIMKMAQNSAKV